MIKLAIVQCSQNHYYDDKKNKTCPYCEKLNGSVADDGGINEQLTSYHDFSDFEDDARLTEAYGESVGDYEKTIGIFLDDTQNVLTAGWLVCIEGAQKGKNFTINAGRNFAGRSLDMDIVLADDDSISRDKHFSIVYDPKTIAFYLVCGEGHTYLNNEPVLSQNQLSEGDAIQVGNSKYLFIPFCKEGRDWN